MSDISNVRLALTAQPKSPTRQSRPKVIAVGTTCYVTTTDNRTVLKGYQVWSNGDLVYDYGATCEERLAREAKIYKHLGRHPQILTCFGLEEVHTGVHSLRLEMAPLGSIRAYIQKNVTSLPTIQHRLQMALDVAIGLSYVHLRGAMSCDLSCANLFLFDGLQVKLGDFGGALLDGCGFEWDQTHESRYQLPSRGREYYEVPHMKRELFSLGSAIYEITAWKKPFSELNDDEDNEKYAKGEFPLLDGNVAKHIIRNCWDEGYATAEEVANDLKSCEWSCI